MAIIVANQIAPLLGNFAPVVNDPQTGAARLTRGISDPAADLLGLSRRSSTELTLVETTSPTADTVKSAISSFFSLTTTVRDAAYTLAHEIDLSYGAAQFDPDTLVTDVSNLIDSFNILRDYVSESSGTLSAALLTQIDSGTDVTDLKYALANIGISIDSDGHLNLDEDVFRQAIVTDQNYVANALGRTAGLAIRELDSANTILNSAAVSVIGFSGAGTTQGLLLTSAQPDRVRLTGQFVDLLF